MVKVISLCFYFLSLSSPLFALLLPISDDVTFTIVEENNRKGLFDEEGNVIIPIAYEDLGWTCGLPEVHSKVIGYRERNHWGLIDVNNNKVTKPLYYSLQPFVSKKIIASRGSDKSRKKLYGLIDNRGRETLSFRYHYLKAHEEQLIAAVATNGKPLYGLIDDSGQAIIGFDYSSIYGVSDERFAVQDKEQKVALFTSEGKQLSSFEYDSISHYNEQGLAIAYQNGKQGVVNQEGVVVVPVEYRRVKMGDGGLVNVLPFSKWHVMTGDNDKLKSYTYESIEPKGVNLFQIKLASISTFVDEEGKPILSENWQITRLVDDFAVVKQGNKYGVMSGVESDKKAIVLDALYDTVLVDKQVILAARKLDPNEYAWSMFDTNGNQLTHYTYQKIKSQSEERFAAKRKGYWGYLDAEGNEVIACQFLSASPFHQNRASVDFLDGQGVIDQYGNWKIKPFKYRGASLSLEFIHDDLYVFGTKAQRYEAAKYGLVDSRGQEIYVGNYPLKDNGHTVWEVNDQGKYGLVGYDGERILDTKYDTISPLQQGVVYTFKKDDSYGIMNDEGEVLVDLENDFQDLYTMHNYFLGVKINDKFGFVDTLGRLRIANRYDSITHFQSNMAAINLLGHWGYINLSETLVVQPHYDEANPFVGGLAIVSKNGNYGMVNKNGELVVPAKYSEIYPTEHDHYAVELSKPTGNAQVGLVDDAGTQLIYPKYDTLEDIGNGYLIISRKGKYGLLTIKGMSTIPLKYDYIKYDRYNDNFLVLEKQRWQSLDVDIQAGR